MFFKFVFFPLIIQLKLFYLLFNQQATPLETVNTITPKAVTEFFTEIQNVAKLTKVSTVVKHLDKSL